MSENYNFHSCEISDCIKHLKSDTNGISHEEAAKRLEKYGPNELPKRKSLSKFFIFFSQFNNPLAYILLFAGTLSLILGEKVDASVIFGAIMINVIIGFVQENKANQALEKLKALVEHESLVIRSGNDAMIDSRLVAIGDIVMIRAGNRIPADARLIESAELQVNEAMLTGESLPSNKRIDKVPPGAALADRENMVYAGTVAVHGWGKAVVCSVGEKTEIGKIAELVKDAKEEKTPLQIRLGNFSKLLSAVFGIICVIIVLAGLSQGRGFIEMLETGVAVGVASIPEGLTMAVTFILALGMQQILKERSLVRRLIATETLGSTTVICSDKTGTLTEGKMHVAHIVIGKKEYTVAEPGSRQQTQEARIASLALQAGMMCNDAKIENPEDELGSWRFIGSPTETALLSAAIQSGLNQDKLLENEPLIDELPFDHDRKYMLSLHRMLDGCCVLYEKGAPEILLSKSKRYYSEGKIMHIDAKAGTELKKTYEDLTSRGLRVIGVAIKNFADKDNTNFKKGEIKWDELNREMDFIGFLAIKDPLRPEAAETIKICQEAGIKPIIITGDHKLTAQAIAREIGLDVKPENIIVGEELEQISDQEFSKFINKIKVFARVNPHHKLRIVKAFQQKGEVVAMTGDGINDSPALKAADIGISLGTGTDIAKETSDIILLDNNFSTIVSAVRQGRIIFKNIRKVITYLISDSFSEMVLIVGSILLGAPLALVPAQILWINIVNDGMPHFSLAFEKGDEKIMKMKPLSKQEPLLNKEMKIIILVVGVFRDLLIFGMFFYLWKIETDIGYLRTLIFAVLGVKSLMSIYSIRALRRPIWKINIFCNKYLIYATGASLALLVLGIYWAPMQKLLLTQSLDIFGWTVAFSIGIFSIFLIELVKYSLKQKTSNV